MAEFWIFFQLGLRHVLDINGYDHLLFLVALTAPFLFKDWKQILILVSIFTLGHTVAMLLNVYNIVSVRSVLIEFLIPVSILITALFTLLSGGKPAKPQSKTAIMFITLFFGIIHGLGFSTYFKSLLSGTPTDKLLPLFEFALGIEAAQVIIVIVVLILSYVVQTFTRFNKRDWTLVLSAFVIGVVLPMIVENDIWK